jgi:acyl-CoA synthetase (AMP-forming)/AMP-acid ligase II
LNLIDIRLCKSFEKINGTTNEVWTFRDILNQSSIMAKAMYGAGVRQNDVVAIISENKHELLAISFGALFLNAVVSPINPSYNERNYIFQFHDDNFKCITKIIVLSHLYRRTKTCNESLKT